MALDLFFVPRKQDFAEARADGFEASDAQLRARHKLLKALAARFDGASIAGKADVGTVEGFLAGTLVARPGYLQWSLHGAGAGDVDAINTVVDWFHEQGLVCEDPQDAGFSNRNRGGGRENLGDWNALVGARLAGIELSDPGISGLNLNWALGDGRHAQLCFVHHRSCEVPPDLTALIRDTIAEVVFTPGPLDDDFRFVFAGGAEIRCAGAVVKSFFAEPAPKSKW
ncbi:hypothetical protein [Tahibacter caeni]|uniref:hypothetical protein n=1 Tax=Tahibacter caeni TaxID=1453545 RepID=UPI0021485491|nr:hypothetical protein [Tahibacter caeni]